VIEDLDSTNGTSLSGVKIEPNRGVGLRVGTVLRVGSFVVYVQAAEPNDLDRAHLVHASNAAPSPATAGARGSVQLREMVLENPKMREAFALIEVVAPSKMSVLILGETGSGKDVYAEALHRASPRAEQSLLRLNCAALPESLLE